MSEFQADILSCLVIILSSVLWEARAETAVENQARTVVLVNIFELVQ